MTKITFRSHLGETRTLDVENGLSVMEAAVRNSIPGIDADCGGSCACATCHVFVGPDWLHLLAPPSELETSMLEFAEGVRPNSRLSCQIKVRSELDGLVVETPASQH